MDDTLNILISVDERHVQNMLKGIKTVELRRRTIRIPTGSRVWIYSKVPAGEICAYGLVDTIIEDAPHIIWEKYGSASGISRNEFDEYFEERDIGCVIVFKSIHKLQENVSLSLLRKKIATFHPPQFYKFLHAESKELALLESQTCFA